LAVIVGKIDAGFGSGDYRRLRAWHELPSGKTRNNWDVGLIWNMKNLGAKNRFGTLLPFKQSGTSFFGGRGARKTNQKVTVGKIGGP